MFVHKKEIKSISKSIDTALSGDSTKIFIHKSSNLAELAWNINLLISESDKLRKENELNNNKKNKLFSDLAHDIRTPLSVILGSLEAIQNGIVDKDEADMYLTRAIQKTNELKSYLEEMFLFARLESGEINIDMQENDICELLRQAVIPWLPFLEQKGFETDMQIGDKEIFVLCNPLYMTRCFDNLIKNAVMHGDEGKFIGIYLADVEKEVLIKIEDKGKGVSQEIHNLIFDRLYKGGNSTSKMGSGLGLSIVKEILTAHKAIIEIESIPYEKTIFSVRFKKVR